MFFILLFKYKNRYIDPKNSDFRCKKFESKKKNTF